MKQVGTLIAILAGVVGECQTTPRSTPSATEAVVESDERSSDLERIRYMHVAGTVNSPVQSDWAVKYMQNPSDPDDVWESSGTSVYNDEGRLAGGQSDVKFNGQPVLHAESRFLSLSDGVSAFNMLVQCRVPFVFSVEGLRGLTIELDGKTYDNDHRFDPGDYEFRVTGRM